jgi:hypothetical protein
MFHGFHHSHHSSDYTSNFIFYAARTYASTTYQACLESDIARVINSFFYISLHAAITDKRASSNRRNGLLVGMSLVADGEAGLLCVMKLFVVVKTIVNIKML